MVGVVLLGCVGSARAAEVVDQAAVSLAAGSTQVRACEPCAQSFVPSRSLHVGVSVRLARIGAGLPETPLRVRLRVDDLSGETVATASILPLQSGAVAAWQDLFFDFPVALDVGRSHVLELSSDDERVAWTFSLSDVYAPGRAVVAGVARDDFDFLFETLIEDGVPDADLDGLPDASDPCPDEPDDGLDRDANGTGDACECGDASADGRLDSIDARLVQRCTVGAIDCPELCDVTGAGCDSVDARLLQLAAVGRVPHRALTCAQDPHRGAPGPVRALRIDFEAGDVLLGWDVPAGPPALRYEVHVARERRFEPGPDTLVVTLPAPAGASAQARLSGLEPDTLHHAVVIAFGDLERGSRPAPFAPFSTPAAP